MIPIKNIYYMLSYAFQTLNESGYANISTEEFDNTADLFASILIKGINIQLKRGLNKNYLEVNESLSTIKGKIDISTSIKTQNVLKYKLNCNYDELSENCNFNRILKTTVFFLLKLDVSKLRKKELKKLMMYFNNVDFIDIYNIDWNIKYNKNNKSYHLLLSICNLVIKGLLHTQKEGKTKLMTYLNINEMWKLYEKFVLEYYRKHFKLLSVSSEQIDWQLDDAKNEMLPLMKSDITICDKNHVLIIDTKYYSQYSQENYGTYNWKSNNLYQIFTYVKNKEYELKNKDHHVSGILLYAKTDENIQPDNIYSMSGNKISIKNLDLNLPFIEISKQLDAIVEKEFLIKATH